MENFTGCIGTFYSPEEPAHRLSCNIGGLEEPYAEIHH